MKGVALQLSLQAIASVLAMVLARRRIQHRPVVYLLAGTLLADLVRLWWWRGPLATPGPYTGTLRALFHIDQLLFLAWPIGLAALAWHVFLRRRPWPPLIGAGIAWAVLIIGYPTPLRGETLGFAYPAIHLTALFAAACAFVVWFRTKSHIRPEHGTTLLAIVLEFAMLGGPYAIAVLPFPWTQWILANVTYSCTFGGLVVIHLLILFTGMWLSPAPPRGGLQTH